MYRLSFHSMNKGIVTSSINPIRSLMISFTYSIAAAATLVRYKQSKMYKYRRHRQIPTTTSRRYIALTMKMHLSTIAALWSCLGIPIVVISLNNTNKQIYDDVRAIESWIRHRVRVTNLQFKPQFRQYPRIEDVGNV